MLASWVISGSLKTMRVLLSVFLSVSACLASGVESAAKPSSKPATAAEAGSQAHPGVSPELEAALTRLKLPGVKIDPVEWCVDVEASVCLRKGLLELIACTKDTKEHESLVVVAAKPSHIHTALLLLRAVPGNPAMHKAIDAEGTRFIPIPPRGGAVDVFLVCKDRDGKQTETPIRDFIARADGRGEAEDGDESGEAGESDKFPVSAFLFAGSILTSEGEGPRQYVCDHSGNLISIATFGDELLCLPDIHDNDNGSLVWEARTDRLPELGTKVILRLRPQVAPRAAPKAGDKPPGK